MALALSALLDRPPNLVLSGVNRGPNLAGDILYSGTCGAAREAALRGFPAAALSVAAIPGKKKTTGAVNPRGVPYWWLALEYLLGAGTPGTDLAAVGAGFISITPPARRHNRRRLAHRPGPRPVRGRLKAPWAGLATPYPRLKQAPNASGSRALRRWPGSFTTGTLNARLVASFRHPLDP